jgi:hypothetical protein
VGDAGDPLVLRWVRMSPSLVMGFERYDRVDVWRASVAGNKDTGMWSATVSRGEKPLGPYPTAREAAQAAETVVLANPDRWRGART